MYEWYFLAQREKRGDNIESLDMDLLFWSGMIFMFIYRGGLGLIGLIASTAYAINITSDIDDDGIFGRIPCICQCFVLLFMFLFCMIGGFIGGVLELGVFVAIYIDQDPTNTLTIGGFAAGGIRQARGGSRGGSGGKQNDSARAGDFQKGVQLTEGVLESMPEVILQSVFIIRSFNDEYLLNNEGAIFSLIVLSIVASIFSIASKYVWIDQLMVIEAADSMFFRVCFVFCVLLFIFFIFCL